MKKIIALLLVVMALFSLVACSSIPDDPIKLGKQIVENCGEDAEIEIMMDYSNIEYMCEDADIDPDDVYAIMNVNTYDGMGVFVFCESSSAAKDVEEALIEMLEDWQADDYYGYYDDFVVERSGKVVYFGEEPLLDEIK